MRNKLRQFSKGLRPRTATKVKAMLHKPRRDTHKVKALNFVLKTTAKAKD